MIFIGLASLPVIFLIFGLSIKKTAWSCAVSLLCLLLMIGLAEFGEKLRSAPRPLQTSEWNARCMGYRQASRHSLGLSTFSVNELEEYARDRGYIGDFAMLSLHTLGNSRRLSQNKIHDLMNSARCDFRDEMNYFGLDILFEIGVAN